MTSNFHGKRVVSFESRRRDQMEKLIRQHGGVPLVAPTMREVPACEASEVSRFIEGVLHGDFDIIVFQTGVGVNYLKEIAAKGAAEEKLIQVLHNLSVVARGPKAAASLRKIGIEPDLVAPEPSTSRDLARALVEAIPLEGKRVAVQEYGTANVEFAEALQAHGAVVTSVTIYRYALPEDTTPVREAIEAIISGNVQVALFTSAPQVRNLMEIAHELGREEQLRRAFSRVVIGAVGPSCAEALRECGFAVDHEPDKARMGDLVRETARLSHFLWRKKITACDSGIDMNRWRRIDMRWPRDDSAATCCASPSSVFLQACRRQPTDYTPVWLMRQAGRFQRAYRDLRARVSFQELCKTPELSAEVTLMAAETLAVDAAIIFADILLILEPLGIEVAYDEGNGPRVKRPAQESKWIDCLASFDPEALHFVYEAVRLVRQALAPEVALIGFAGAPFTVASYLLEGGTSRDYQHTKGLFYRDPSAWHALMERIVAATTSYLNRQIAAGADAVQLFDSWVGCLSPDDYREFVLPHMRRLIEGIEKSTPVIHFATGNPALLPLQREAGGDVIGIDWRVDLAQAWETIGFEVAIQGNLDPAALFAPPAEIRKRVQRILERAAGRPGHIFNLGHGILPGTPVDHVLELVDAVHELSQK